MKKKQFTLIEMLVVIAIISILAGMVMPALGHARATAQRTNCISNQKQLITAMILYAGENDNQMIYRSVKGNGARNYAAILNGLNGNLKEYMPRKALMCSVAKADFKVADDKTYGNNAIGMLNALSADVDNMTDGIDPSASGAWLNKDFGSGHANSGKARYKTLGRFANTFYEAGKAHTAANSIGTVVYAMDRMKAPGELVIFADTFKKGKDETFWSFTPDAYSSNENATVTLIHSGTAVVAFADGRADAQNAGQLKDGGTEITKLLNSDFEDTTN